MFNIRRVATWRILNAHVTIFRMFNFRRLSNWQKILTAEISQSTVFETDNFQYVKCSQAFDCLQYANWRPGNEAMC